MIMVFERQTMTLYAKVENVTPKWRGLLRLIVSILIAVANPPFVSSRILYS
jgi:hypothetical protein